MKLYVAGGCSEHGRNSYLVTTAQISFLVDAGVMKEHPERPFPALSDEQIKNAKYLFLTHCHTDHTGAIPWLRKHGFEGIIIASRATVDITKYIDDAIPLEELGRPLVPFHYAGLKVTWGRSGHCVGSVWYRFEAENQSIFFSGDYQEKTYAYECDCVRGMKADLGVIDCAYGLEKEDADVHRAELEACLDELTRKKGPLLFPIPSHGRGTDLLQLMSERGRDVVVCTSIVDEFRNHKDRGFWLRDCFRKSIEPLHFRSYELFEKELEEAGGVIPENYDNAAVLVRDSQLYDEKHQKAADAVVRAGGTVVLTGKQDPASYARKMLDEGNAVFYRISVHQNASEFRTLADHNEFTQIVPCHCRQQLVFTDPDVVILKPEDTLNV